MVLEIIWAPVLYKPPYEQEWSLLELVKKKP